MSASLSSDKLYHNLMVGSCFVTEATNYTPSVYILFGQDHLLPLAMHNFTNCAISFRVICWVFITISLIYLFLFTFLFPLCISSRGFSVVIMSDALAILSFWCGCCYWCYYAPSLGLYMHCSGVPCPIMAPGLVLCARCILPCKNSRLLHSCYVRWPLGYPIRQLPYIWTIILQMLIYVIRVVELAFLSSLACHILNLANKHGITFILAYISTHLNVEADYLFQDQLVPKVHLLPHTAQAVFCLWDLQEVDLLSSSCTNKCRAFTPCKFP